MHLMHAQLRNGKITGNDITITSINFADDSYVFQIYATVDNLNIIEVTY